MEARSEKAKEYMQKGVSVGTGGSQRAGESGAVQWKVKNEESIGHM